MTLLKLLKGILSVTIGKLSPEDRERLKTFLEEIIKAAAKGAMQGAIYDKS